MAQQRAQRWLGRFHWDAALGLQLCFCQSLGMLAQLTEQRVLTLCTAAQRMIPDALELANPGGKEL